MLGLLILLVAAGALIVAVLGAMIAWEATHPSRRTTAWAVARGLPADPGEAGLHFEEWILDRPGGVQLPVWEVRVGESGHVIEQSTSEHPDSSPAHPHSPGPSSLTVIFIHGWGQSRIDMLIRRRPYHELAARLIMYDLRGHGEAEGISRLGDGEHGDLHALLRRLGGGDVLLVGHSMGGVIAARAAAELQRDPVEGVVLRGIVMYGPYTDTRLPLANRLKALHQPSRIVPDLGLFMLRLAGIRGTSRTDLARLTIDAPMLILHGERDVITPLDAVRDFAEAIQHGSEPTDRSDAPQRRVRLEILPDTGHADAHEKAPHDHDRIVRDFVSSISEGWGSGIRKQGLGNG